MTELTELEEARRELSRLLGYQAREPRRFGRVGTWDEAVDRARAEVARLTA